MRSKLNPRIIPVVFCFLLPDFGFAQFPFHVNGSATALSDNCFQITSEDSLNQAGSAWCEVPISLDNSFDMTFSVNLGCNQKSGEGMAFVLHADPHKDKSLGCPGPFLGFAPSSTYNCIGIRPSMAVEIDTRYTTTIKASDMEPDHISLVKNGNQAKLIKPSVRASASSTEISDCDYHTFRITWKPSMQIMNIWFDEELKIRWEGDLQSEFFGNEKSIWFGFTGSNGETATGAQSFCVRNVTLEVDTAYLRKKDFEKEVNIMYNPSTEQVIVDTDSKEDRNIDIQIFDSQGKLLDSKKRKGKKTRHAFNLTGRTMGMYYITVSDGSNRVNKRIFHTPVIRA